MIYRRLSHQARILHTSLAAIFAELDRGRRQHAATVLRFRLATGCRPQDACRIKWEWFHPDAGKHGLFRIPPDQHKTGAKTHRDRVIYLTAEARTIIDGRPRTGPHVFTNRRGRPFKPSGLRSTFYRASKAAGFPISSYRLRHQFAFAVMRQGIPVDVLKELLGHEQIKTTEIYYRAEQAAALAAVSRLPSLSQTPRAPAPPTAKSRTEPTPRKTQPASPRRSAKPKSA